MNNKKDIEEDIEQLRSLKADRESFIIGEKEHDEIYLKDIQAIENILADRERLIKDNNEKDKKIKAMSLIENTSKYEDTILIDENRVNRTRRRKFLIELNNGEFVEVNKLQAKANKYDSLVEKIKNKIEELKQELVKVEQMSASATRYEVIQKLNNQINILQELLDIEKEKV